MSRQAVIRLARLAQPLVLTLVLTFVLALGLAAPTLHAAPAEKPDHVHLTITLFVAADQPRPAGDVLGLYAAEMLTCKSEKSAATGHAMVLAWLDQASSMLMSSAWANHRDHFDRPGATIVPTRVPLDRAASFGLGEVTLPQGSYCQIRLTLTRLPAVTEPRPLPPLGTSVSLARSAGLPPLALTYPVALELPLAKPWQARSGAATLKITLHPGSANDLLADANLSEGALVRLLAARWVETSKLVLTQGR